jgi:hypothetical protein
MSPVCGQVVANESQQSPIGYQALDGFSQPAHDEAGGSRKGSKGNAVRDLRNAVAAPATVSGESSLLITTGNDIPGKVGEGRDPRARRPATSSGHARARRAGLPGVVSVRPFAVRASGEAHHAAVEIAVTARWVAVVTWHVFRHPSLP